MSSLEVQVLRKKWDDKRFSIKYKNFKARINGNLICEGPPITFGMEVYRTLQTDSLRHGIKWVRFAENNGKLTFRNLKYPGVTKSTTNSEAIRRFLRWFAWIRRF